MKTLNFILFLAFVSHLILVPLVVYAQAQISYGGVFVYGMSEPEQLRAVEGSRVDAWYCLATYDASLIYLNSKAEFEPYLAKSWEVTPDGLTYTFHLLDNVTWHDGTPFTSADVKYSFEEIKMKIRGFPGTGKDLADRLIGVETPDDYTAIFRFRVPYVPIIEVLDQERGALFPKHIYDHTVNPDAPEDVRENPENWAPYTGLGPYKFVEWISGSHMTMEKNENYFKKGKPYLDKVIFKFIQDPTARATALEMGEIDYNPTLSPYDAKRLKEAGPEETGINIIATYDFQRESTHIRFELDPSLSPISGNFKVRQAIAQSVDRAKYVNLAMLGFGKEGYYPYITSLSKYVNLDDSAADRYPYNLTRAEELLDEAGYPRGDDGIRFMLRLPTSATEYDQIKSTEIFRDEMRELGIIVDIIHIDSAASRAVTEAGDFDVMFHSGKTFPFFEVTWNNFVAGNYRNYVRYNNTRYNEIIPQILEEVDEEKRTGLMQEAQALMLNDIAILPIYEEQQIIGCSTNFKFETTPMVGFDNLDSVYFVGGEEPPSEPTVLGIPVMYIYIIIGVVIVAGLVAVFWRRLRR